MRGDIAAANPGVTMNEHAVVIVGAGPTGLMLAGELALAGVDVAVIERRTSQALPGSRAGGLHARTLEILDQRGIVDRFLSQGKPFPVVHFHIPFDMSDFPTRHNYTLALWQNHIERILAEWIDELAVPIYRGCEVNGFLQDDADITVTLSDGRSMQAEYLVGCDGGRSVIRKTAGIEFRGWDPTTSWLIAETRMAEEPQWRLHEDDAGIHAIGKGDDGSIRVVLTERQLRTDNEPTLRDIRDALIAIYGTDYGIDNPTWISRFTDVTRQAAVYRNKRILLAGDAAHVHPPLGGQGLNIGVQDAMNLGWKLAQVVKRISPQHLLDTYHAERHPVAAMVLRNTMAQVALRRTDDRSKALRDTMTELLGMDEPRKHFAARMSGLDIRYTFDAGNHTEAHALLGRRIPDLELMSSNGSLRVFTLLHNAQPVLLNFGEPASIDITPWADRVQLIDADYTGQWELPVIGNFTPPDAVLVRPDGHVAWVGDRSQIGLADVLACWFGSPAG